jgi:hypothetical protein
MKDASVYLGEVIFQIKNVMIGHKLVVMIVFSFVQLHCMKFCVLRLSLSETSPGNLLSVHNKTGQTQVSKIPVLNYISIETYSSIYS